MRTIFERSFLVGIGLLSMTHEKANKVVDEMIQRGEVQRDDAKKWVERLAQRGDEERQAIHKLIHDEVRSALDELDLATKQDVQDLAAKIETLDKQGKA